MLLARLKIRAIILTGLSASSILPCAIRAQSAHRIEVAEGSAPAANSHPAGGPPVFNAVTSTRQAMMYRRLWGIEDIHVRITASSSLNRLSYRIVNADKAGPLTDKKATPYLIDEANGVALQVPTLEKIGQLRQTATAIDGREYWMAFSNKGRYVKRGNRVDILAGSLRINGLVVE